MKATTIIRPKHPHSTAWIACLGIIVALFAGCVSTDVTSIVAESNAALFATQLPDTELAGDPASVRPAPDPAAVSQRIDDFIAAHPGQKVATSALRVRQAILLISCEKYELARAAFADATELKTDRDRALKNVSESIIWWWQHARLDHWEQQVRGDAQGHLSTLDAEIARVRQSPEIRDYLEEMRARLGFELAKKLQASQGKRDVFIAAMNHYSASLTPEDVAAIKSGNLAPQSTAISPAEKRRLRAVGVIKKAREPLEGLRAAGQPVAVTDLAPDARAFGALVLAP